MKNKNRIQKMKRLSNGPLVTHITSLASAVVSGNQMPLDFAQVQAPSPTRKLHKENLPGD